MREILFRIKNHDEWYYGYPTSEVKHSDEVGNYVSFMGNSIKDGSPYYDLFAVADTLGEYTGLTDKNGTKIFEGDILQEFYGNKYNVLGFVEFGEGTFDSGIYRYTGFYFKEKDGNKDHTNLHPKLIKEYGMEVIGNIYDNPELLTDKT